MRLRVREKAWADFVAWCKARRLEPLPAHPWTLAAYARWCESRHRYPALLNRIRAIARAHLLHCAPPPDRHPVVTRTLRLIELRERSRPLRGKLFADPASPPADTAAPEKERKTAARRVLRTTPPLVSRRPAG
jgi:hypothetical protein